MSGFLCSKCSLVRKRFCNSRFLKKLVAALTKHCKPVVITIILMRQAPLRFAKNKPGRLNHSLTSLVQEETAGNAKGSETQTLKKKNKKPSFVLIFFIAVSLTSCSPCRIVLPLSAQVVIPLLQTELHVNRIPTKRFLISSWKSLSIYIPICCFFLKLITKHLYIFYKQL